MQDKINAQAIIIVDQERYNWEDAVSFITPKVGFRMREMIRIFRKNFWGVFDEPVDKNTGREKIWINLAQATIEAWVKNIDIDQKDVNFIARNPQGYDITQITRLAVKDYLDRMYFGEILDSDERQVLIDGTVVWKTWEDNSTGKPVMKRKTIDLLNFYIDPTEENIQTAYRVTERAILLPEQISAMSGWSNRRSADGTELPGSQVLNRIDGSRRSNFGTRTTGNYRDVWEMWGKIPKWMITMDDKADDAFDEIDGHVIVSGLETSSPVVHLVEENTKKDKFGNVLKPYEEWRAAKINGRWYGLGPIERILALQEYLNTIMNIRISRSYVSQLGLFKIKKGKGITSTTLSRLQVNGAVQVTDMDDVQQLNVQEASDASYKDEEVIKGWAQQISSAFPISNGEILPASTSATATTVASGAAKSAYTMFKEGAGMFLERWIDRHSLPIIAKTITIGQLHKMSSDEESYKKVVEQIAINSVMSELQNSRAVPSEQEVLNEIQKETARLMAKPQLFLEVVQDLVAEHLDPKVVVTNEEIDVGVTINNLIQLMQIAPEYRESMIRDVYDLMGLSLPKVNAQPQGQPGQPQTPPGQTPGVPMGQPGSQQAQPSPMNMQQIMQNANIRKQ